MVCLTETNPWLTYIKTRAKAFHIHNSLIAMKQKTPGNIGEFNDWVCKQVGQLHASGVEATDLLAYLWKTYLVMPDQGFVDYIKFLHNEYEDACIE